ncbi:MAG TPA: PIG-L deacetylase family protein [Terriglobales bacterium]|nr:PIG-L deacetylase family protein [Terriglobales bacterium]
MRKILCVTAHPDDEVATFGGTVSHYARLGVHCRLICLTAGESAKNRGAATDPAALKALRSEELAASCKLLQFAGHELWDMGDARLPQAPFYYVLSRLVAAIRRFQPDVVLSFGPEGSVTAHPDHGMTGTFATTAFHWAAHQKFFPELGLPPFRSQRLFYATAAFQPPQFEPVWLPAPNVAMPVGEFLERKIEAFTLHRSQAPLLERVTAFMRLAGQQELFHLAAGKPLPDSGPADDLFAGI